MTGAPDQTGSSVFQHQSHFVVASVIAGGIETESVHDIVHKRVAVAAQGTKTGADVIGNIVPDLVVRAVVDFEGECRRGRVGDDRIVGVVPHDVVIDLVPIAGDHHAMVSGVMNDVITHDSIVRILRTRRHSTVKLDPFLRHVVNFVLLDQNVHTIVIQDPVAPDVRTRAPVAVVHQIVADNRIVAAFVQDGRPLVRRCANVPDFQSFNRDVISTNVDTVRGRARTRTATVNNGPSGAPTIEMAGSQRNRFTGTSRIIRGYN